MKPSTYLKQRYSLKEATRKAFIALDYYLCVEDIQMLESKSLNKQRNSKSNGK